MEKGQCRECGIPCDKRTCRKCRESIKRVAQIVGSSTFDIDCAENVTAFGGRYMGGHMVEVRSGRRVVRK